MVGFSDITGLHWFLHSVTGLRTFYGPGAIPELGAAVSSSSSSSSDHDDKSSSSSSSEVLAFSTRNLFRTITATDDGRKPLGEIPRSRVYAPSLPPFSTSSDPASTDPSAVLPNPGWVWLRGGRAQGRLFGGCLTVVARLAGVKAVVPDWRGRIVFLETAIDEDMVSGNPLHRVQAGFADLIAQGVFEEAAGLVVGRPFGYDAPEMRERYTGVIMGFLGGEGKDGGALDKVKNGDFPILFGVDFGHTTPMVTLPFDALAELDSERDRFAVLEAGVV